MSMGTSDYVIMASVINTARLKSTNGEQLVALRRLTDDLAVALEKVNPRFDTHKFQKACGFAA